MLDVRIASNAYLTRSLAATPKAVTPLLARKARENTPTGDLQTLVLQLLDALNAAKLAGALATEIKIC